MSLLNDALRKKSAENQNNSDTHRAHKPVDSQNKSKIKLSRIAILLFLVGSIVLGTRYFVGALSHYHKLAIESTPIDNENTPQTAISASNPKNDARKINTVSPNPLKPMAEFPPKKDLQPIKPLKIQKNVTETVLKRKSQQIALKTTKAVRKPIQKPPSRESADKAESAFDRQELRFYQKALRYHRRGKLKQAVHMYRQVLKRTPEQPDAMFNLASAYIQMKAYAEAYYLLKHIKMRDSTNPDVLLNLAIAEIGLGRPINAMRILDAASQYFSEPQFSIHFHRAVAWSRLGELRNSLAEYKKAEKLNASHPSVLFNLAVISDKLQKYVEAVIYYRKYLNQNPKLSNHEKKKINARIRTLQAFTANKQSKIGIEIDG
jgi:Flp pilus assembly protein TadD